jgi:hypothetical protein
LILGLNPNIVLRHMFWGFGGRWFSRPTKRRTI